MSYNSLKVLSEIEHIRKRPSMWIGDTTTPSHLLYEVIDNALDEAAAGHVTLIKVETQPDGQFSVYDNGRGFPEKDENKDDAITTAVTKLFSGAKFDNDAYKTAIGLHGVGLVAVNALCSSLTIASTRNKTHMLRLFENGERVTSENRRSQHDASYTTKGTKVTATPDPQYFETVKINQASVLDRLRLALTLIQNVEIVYNGAQAASYSADELLQTNSDTGPERVEVVDSKGQRAVVYFGYKLTQSDFWNHQGAVNLLRVNRGSHINQVYHAIYDAWSEFVEDKDINRNDVGCGLYLFVSMSLSSPKYTSQTKDCLQVAAADLSELRSLITTKVSEYLRNNVEIRTKLLRKFEEYRKMLNRVNSSKFLDGVLEFGDVSDSDDVKRRSFGKSKLIDCTATSRDITELFVVEGDSAAGPLIRRRDRNKHAILPLRGKVLNVVDRSIQYIMSNTEIKSLINGIGAGAFFKTDTSRIRYGKIILMTDADEDGKNILALLIGCLCYIVPDVVYEGHLYIAQAPIYGQYDRRGGYHPVYHKDSLNPKWSISRYKGLGEMDDSEIVKVAFEEKTRNLVQLGLDKQDVKEIIKIVGTSAGKKQILECAGLIA